MNQRQPRREPSRSQSALVHRGPGAHSAPHSTPTTLHHAPNAALLIDFDNVTMGIRSDLGKELRNLLSSEIIKGKVAVQRADIRLAIDALELVFTRPEIGIFILLSGDSDFSSMVIKLKEYGKYVIGVGIRESSSDLLVQNCDEYYSYNALAGLVKSSDDEPRRKYDPWELVREAITQMKQNHDVMRSDRLKQVMQEIDPTFDEKDLGISKFSKFCQEAASKGLLSVRRLENGQLEVDTAGVLPAETLTAIETPTSAQRPVEAGEDRPERVGRPRRGRGGRGRGGRGRETRTPDAASAITPVANLAVPAAAAAPRQEGAGASGERLTRDEAFDLLKRTVASLVHDDNSVRASAVRLRARELLGRDTESLNERNFTRILKDAHDANVLDLRRRGDDFEVARAESAPSVSDQLAKAQPAPPKPADAGTPSRLSLRGRGSGPRGRMPAVLPPELLSLGVVQSSSLPARDNGDEGEVHQPPPRKRGGRKRGAKPALVSADNDAAVPSVSKAAKRPRRPAAKRAPPTGAKREGPANKHEA
jgi:hypothetical protein